MPEKNFTTISPSAKSLLLLKGFTGIPFAQAAARLMGYPEPVGSEISKRDFRFWARVMHFENRYWSVDQLLAETKAKNILELSSGYSLRSLDSVIRDPVHYIDTDLEEVVSLKKQFIAALEEREKQKGILEILPLNALDEEQFRRTVSRFSPGPVVIVNEGLLMYLNGTEKRRLCSIIHQILKERGGCWITADIYIKQGIDRSEIALNDREKLFFEQHQIENNKFESFQMAETFFKEARLIKVKEARRDHEKLSALPHLLSAYAGQTEKIANSAKVRATWMLEAV